LKLYEEIDQKPGVIASRLTIAANLVKLGEYDSALKSLNQAFALAESQNHVPYMISALNNIGATYGEKGNYGKAIEFLEKSAQLSGKEGQMKQRAATLNNIGFVHIKQRNYAQALAVLQQGLYLSESRGTKADSATSFNMICTVYNAQGDYEKAVEHCKKSLRLSEETGSDNLMAESLSNLGVLYLTRGKITQAIESLEKCLTLYQKAGSKNHLSMAFANLASAYIEDSKPIEALRHAEQAVSVAKALGNAEYLFFSYNILGKVYLALDRLTDARAALIESIAFLETLRSESASGEIQRQNFLEERTSPYQRLIALSVKQNDSLEALRRAEQMKARLLLDVLHSGRVQIAKAMTEEEREQERTIKNELASLNSQIFNESSQDNPDKARLTTLNEQLEKARLRHQNFQTRLYAAHPDLKLQRGQTKTFNMDQAAALLSDNRTALIEYVLTEEKAFLFVIVRDNEGKPSLKTYPLAAKSEEVINLARKYRELLATRNALFREAAVQLYDLLLKPAQAELRGKTKLVIVPDGALWELPFQALVNEKKRYLIEDYSISFAPSLTVLAEMKQRRRQKRNFEAPTLLAFGNPNLGKEQVSPSLFKTRAGDFAPLPETEIEVKKLATLYGKERSLVFTGPMARESELKQRAANYKVLHLATHSILNDESPMYSQIVLSQENAPETGEDGLLEAWEILQLDLKSDLVVLSACETARGRIGEGEGMIGLSWALFVAGAPTTVVSQWKVDSASTSDLMLEFHRNLQTNSAKAESLRKAALKLTQNKQYSHPFYWAAFVVVGDD
jgi:CHAT domain-containing protein